eukprot:g16831.t1
MRERADLLHKAHVQRRGRGERSRRLILHLSNFHVNDALYCNHDNGYGGRPEFKCQGSNQKLLVRNCKRATCDEQYNTAKAPAVSAFACDSDYKQIPEYVGKTCAKGRCTRDNCCEKRKCKHVYTSLSSDWCDGSGSSWFFDESKPESECGTVSQCSYNACCLHMPKALMSIDPKEQK